MSALKGELATERDRFLRLAADFDNFSKRVAQESERRATLQKKAFIQELLPIIDNLERARQRSVRLTGTTFAGVELTLQQLNPPSESIEVKKESVFEAVTGQPVRCRLRQFDSLSNRPTKPRPDKTFLLLSSPNVRLQPPPSGTPPLRLAGGSRAG